MPAAPARAGSAGAPRSDGKRARRKALAKGAQPLEQRILLTATLCLLAFGAVMVYSASSATSLLQGQGNGSGYLVKYLVYGAIGLVLMRVLARDGVAKVQAITGPLLITSFVLVLAVHVPHVGVSVNGARRWLGAGPLQFQPSELMKLALVLYARDAAGQAPAARARSARAGQAAARRRRRRDPARRHAAGPRHGDGDRLHDDRAAGRRGHRDAQSGDRRRLRVRRRRRSTRSSNRMRGRA